MTCIKYMFLMVYFIPKSNSSVYVKTIPFPPIRTSLLWGGIFSDAVICWLKYRQVPHKSNRKDLIIIIIIIIIITI